MIKKLFACAFGLCIIFSALFSIGCAGAKGVKEADLSNRRFVLESVDGKAFTSANRTPDIAFGENFRVQGGICNRYTGQGVLAGNVLTVKQMASTKMLCVDDALNKLETQFAQMLHAGAEVTLDGKTLTLRQGGHTLVYTAADRVK